MDKCTRCGEGGGSGVALGGIEFVLCAECVEDLSKFLVGEPTIVEQELMLRCQVMAKEEEDLASVLAALVGVERGSRIESREQVVTRARRVLHVLEETGTTPSVMADPALREFSFVVAESMEEEGKVVHG